MQKAMVLQAQITMMQVSIARLGQTSTLLMAVLNNQIVSHEQALALM